MYFFIRGCDALLTYTIVIAEMDMNGGLKISSNMFVNVWRIWWARQSPAADVKRTQRMRRETSRFENQ